MTILAGDIGGTNMRLELVSFNNSRRKSIFRNAYKCKKYHSVQEIIKAFISESGVTIQDIESICLAVACPVVGGKAKFTNLPWSIDREELKVDLGIEKLSLINDFQSVGYGIETLEQEDLYTLQQGVPQEDGEHRIKAVIGAGTGLGVGYMYWNGEKYTVCPTEGGHVSFAPDDDVQVEILRFLRRKYRTVSSERLLSGPGLVHIYEYFRDLDSFNDRENPDLKFEMHTGDAAATITKYAIEHQDPMALQALDAFIRIYGSRVGDLAYTLLPRGGLYIAGGIASKMLDQMTDGRFMQAYRDKGRLSKILNDIPLYIVLNTDVGLQGASLVASRL